MATRVLILGGGVIGTASALACAKAGLDVTLVERRPAQRDGCSFGNAGMVVPSHFVPLAAPGMVALGLKWMWNPKSPFYVRPRLDRSLFAWGWRFWRSSTRAHVDRCAPLLRDLSLASRVGYEEWDRASGGAFGLEKRGLLMLCATEHAFRDEAKFAEEANRLGVPAEVHDARATAALEPDLAMRVAGSVLFPLDAHLSPGALMGWLESEATRAGVRFLWETESLGWRREGRRVVALRTSAGDLSADEYVLCAGAWTPQVARGLDLRLPMQAGKGYSLTLPEPRRLPKRCAILVEARIAVTPIGSSLRFGGTMEIAGADESINPTRVLGIQEAIPRYYPEFSVGDFASVRPWVGLRPVSPDGMPYLGRPSRYDNLVVAAGHAMMGVSLAPVTARTVAALLTGAKPEFDLSLLSPDRFE